MTGSRSGSLRPIAEDFSMSRSNAQSDRANPTPWRPATGVGATPDTAGKSYLPSS